MLVFVNKFPFIRFEKKPVAYEYRLVNGKVMTDADISLIKQTKKNLSNHNINLNKIKIVVDDEFFYDIDTNTINPQYAELISNKKEIISLNKPERIIRIQFRKYVYFDDDIFLMLKKALKYQKRGVVVKACADFEDGIEMISLDDEVEKHIIYFDNN